MVGIKEIGTYIPQNFEFNTDKMRIFEFNDDFMKNKIGVIKTARKLPDEDTSDLCVNAFNSLKNKMDISCDEIDCLVVCTQNPDKHGIPHTSAIIHGKLGLDEKCATFDISLGCSGYIYSLSIVKSFMEANELNKGVIFTADPYSKRLNPNDKTTVLLFGDAATATLLENNNSIESLWYPQKFLFFSQGKYGDALNNDNEMIEMNGRAVFNFSATQVPNQVKELLQKSNIEINDIDLFLFHQGSKYIVDNIIKRLKIPPEKAPFSIYDYGNTVSSSIPILFENYIHDKNIRTVVMSGFGVGLSCASTFLTRR